MKYLGYHWIMNPLMIILWVLAILILHLKTKMEHLKVFELLIKYLDLVFLSCQMTWQQSH